MRLMGKPVAEQIKNEIREAVQICADTGKALPKLAILRVGERADDLAYEARLVKNCTELGISVQVSVLNQDISMEDFLQVLHACNRDSKIHGILIFRPLPAQLHLEEICGAIEPEKDIDCMSPVNAGKIFTGEPDGILPCTPEAVIEILKYYGYALSGKNVAIVNRSMVLGKPLAMLFLAENSTVTICHSKTVNLAEVTAEADIVVTGVGRAKYFGSEFFSKKSVVVDVGINTTESGLCGDADFERAEGAVSAITPVPGGVGTVTSMILLRNVIRAMKQQEAKG